MGVELAERGARQAEGLELIRKLWAEDRVTFEGDFTKMNDVNMEPKSAQPGGIPVWIGGQHSGALARAGKMGDGWLAPKVTTECFHESSAKVLEAGTDSGRDMKDFQYVVELGIHMDQDIGKARREAARALGESKEPPTDMLMEQSLAIGNADDCASRIQQFVDAGVTWFVLAPMCSSAEYKEQVERYAAELLPRFSGVKASV